jgi:hypothetical protein
LKTILIRSSLERRMAVVATAALTIAIWALPASAGALIGQETISRHPVKAQVAPTAQNRVLAHKYVIS